MTQNANISVSRFFFNFEAPQNDRLNLSFLKDIYVDGGKFAINGRKTGNFCQSQILVISL